jgi:hypothetical protein
MTKHIDLSTFTTDDVFYGKIDLLLTVKNFDLQSIRKRYIASKTNVSGKAGSVERRKVGTGGICFVTLENGKLNKEEVFVSLKEPRGIAIKGNILAIAAENSVYLITDEIRTIENPWFSYIHTIDFNPFDETKVLVASSGLDCIFEYDLNTLEQVYAWHAWENGFNESINKEGETVILTRDPDEAIALKEAGKDFKLIRNPENETLPTAQRAAFINTVTYDTIQKNHFLATFFHEGAVFRIDMASGKATKVVDGMKNPHGGRNEGDLLMATSTGTGEIIRKGAAEETKYQFSNLSGKEEALGDMEWIQNAIDKDGNIIAIDSNRTSFIVFNPASKLISKVAYNENWAVQDLVLGSATAKQIELMKSLGA